MSHKLTEQEQGMILSLAKLLGKRLSTDQRSNAGGIASGLVRLRKERLASEDVDGVLEKYGAGKEVRRDLEELGVLVPEKSKTPGSNADDTYVLVLPQEPEEDRMALQTRTQKTTRAIATATVSKPPMRQVQKRKIARSLTGLGCVRKQSPELNEVRRKIIGLDPRLWINGWLLSTPEAYASYEKELIALDHALVGATSLGDGTLSGRELSYRIFGDEKFLSVDGDGRKLLHFMGLTDIVRCHPQAKLGLLHHIPRHHDRMRLVVSENLDPWLNMRDAMYLDGRKRILGERVHGVIFGTGYLVNDPHKLPDLLDTLGADEIEVLYWGDIDRAGLSILSKLVDETAGRFAVTPFAEAYHLMLERAMERFPDPLDNETTDQEAVPLAGLDLMEPLLKKREMAYLRDVVENSRLLPQEILTRSDL